MCGRFTLFAPAERIIRRFGLTTFPEAYVKRYNIAPSQPVLAVIHDGKENRAGFLRWGLIPSWANDEKIGYKLINARAETLGEKRSFQEAAQKRRCLIIADGFYEWKREGNRKQPVRVQLKTGELFAMAGLWERWQSPNGEVLYTCAIVTTEANDLLRPFHPRMPVILPAKFEARWLDRSARDLSDLQPLLKPYMAEEMLVYPVSDRVNSAAYDGPDLIEPVE
ncbi:MAG: hypothetical protein BAA01_05915 [Bacillus thermozeamaize]|jgi:putative SOS response-associated peptidase YedK|uniref:Abasic site processing protein n=1 Tax=Bacillus thermozeamaize TaxID=230954 RepID=A0A1Y3PBF0_9BACI|nr:MAG: hypothetical protein BAA01_05915 [Bacillus thermozeamaize]